MSQFLGLNPYNRPRVNPFQQDAFASIPANRQTFSTDWFRTDGKLEMFSAFYDNESNPEGWGIVITPDNCPIPWDRFEKLLHQDLPAMWKITEKQEDLDEYTEHCFGLLKQEIRIYYLLSGFKDGKNGFTREQFFKEDKSIRWTKKTFECTYKIILCIHDLIVMGKLANDEYNGFSLHYKMK
jgi:hypothetical protein